MTLQTPLMAKTIGSINPTILYDKGIAKKSEIRLY
jgi:hypothetical protein